MRNADDSRVYCKYNYDPIEVIVKHFLSPMTSVYWYNMAFAHVNPSQPTAVTGIVPFT
jgi:hypothetical protein